MLDLLPFVIFGIAFAVLIVVVTGKARAKKAAQGEKLVRMGFEPCDTEADALTDRIKRLENNAEYRYSVDRPMRASLDGKTVYYYSKSRHRQGSIVAADEFLLWLQRPSSEGLVLFVKPSNLPAGTATNLIGAMATGAWDSQPDDLKKMEIPPDLQGTNVIGALGPRGASLYDLIDSQTLALMQQMGDAGVLIAPVPSNAI